MVETPGRTKLIKWLEADEARSQSALARALGIKQASVWSWLQGHARPALNMRPRLEVVTSRAVKAADWETKDERHARKEADRQAKATAERFRSSEAA